ncbi:hypothetical protein NPIL_511591, partial [Nephila pilipes]
AALDVSNCEKYVAALSEAEQLFQRLAKALPVCMCYMTTLTNLPSKQKSQEESLDDLGGQEILLPM